MKRLWQRALSPLAIFRVPLFLLGLCLLAYVPLLTKLGFYWDDFPMAWIASSMGGAGLARYFSTNRPVWGLLYQITTPLLGSNPVVWQISAVLLRWGSGVVFWALLRSLWPARRQTSGRETFAVWSAAAWVIYPGFSQQFIALLYSHFFIILIVFLLSMTCMVWAVRLQTSARRAWFWPLTGLALLLSAWNLLSMEYFFLLDLLRPLMIAVILYDRQGGPYLSRSRLGKIALAWLPYLAIFVGVMYWRSVIFGFQTYQPALMARLKAEPIPALMQLVPLALKDVWISSVGAWVKAFSLPDALSIGALNMQRYWLFTAAGGLAAALFLWVSHPAATQPSSPGGQGRLATAMQAGTWAVQPLVIGLFALFLAGGPFWLTDLQIGLVFPNDRFTLPFLLGASLIFASLLTLLPLPHGWKAGLLGIALGFAIGLQYQYAIAYNRDWSVQRAMFWQMTWRMPDLQPGTALLSNELPVIHYTDNSLTAPLNWTYAAPAEPGTLPYALFYPTIRKEDTLSSFQKHQPITLNYLAATFHGNTDQMVAFYYAPPGCVRVLDPQVEIYNWTIPEYLRESLPRTSTTPILPIPADGKPAPRPPERVYGAEIARGWCYDFEKADLARQMGDWEHVAAIGDLAFAAGDYPNDPLERFPFIEGYAHVGNWERAAELTRQSSQISPVMMQPMLCKIWQRIAGSTPVSTEKQHTIQTIRQELACEQ